MLTVPLIFSLHFFIIGGSYMVVDCGGGTVDITVHEISTDGQQLREVFKATGGPYGSVSKYIFLFINPKIKALCIFLMHSASRSCQLVQL